MDYCSLLYFGIEDGVMSRLQSVQNAAARLITGVQAYHASSTSVVLAASLQTSGIQDTGTHPRLLFVGWHCSCVPS